uniref:Uncharacterized protein n=1 Tax=Anopheles dirus TaxID=7168 RepID=A0A182NDM7_9DIPT
MRTYGFILLSFGKLN